MPHDGDTTDEQLTNPHTGLAVGELGDAEVRLELDADTYERVRAAFTDAKEAGYPGKFSTFAFNHCSTEYVVEVDDERSLSSVCL